MWHAFRMTVVATVLGCWILPAMAEDSPAQLVVGEDSIEEQLRLPLDLKPGRYAVHCEAGILRDGSASGAYCYTMAEPAPDNLVKAVATAASAARFVPAVRNVKPIEVYAVFMVLIDTTLAEPMVLAVPNNGVERQRYGLLYTSPQRVTAVATAPRMPNSPNQLAASVLSPSTVSWRFSSRADSEPLFIWMQFQIDEHGSVRDLKLTNRTPVDPDTMRRYEKAARKYEFLPGYYEGRPTSMLYVEPLFSSD